MALFSIIIPCRNEEKYIKGCIQSILDQKGLPGDIEILVIDGLSDDKTVEVIERNFKEKNNVKVIKNTKKTTPFALNLGINNSTGDFICIIGAHAEYDPFFLKNAYDLFILHPEISCAGGPIISLGQSSFGKSAAIAMSSPIGVGNAKHRFPDYEGYAEMACFPVFKREVFDLVGLYDESLTKNQDDEFCFRLRLRGLKVYISPKVKSTYYVRSSVKSLFKQYYDYGKWRIAVIKKHKIPISFRQQIPAIFLILLLFMAVLSLFLKNIWIGILIPIFYLSAIISFSLPYVKKMNLKIAALIPLAIIILHFSYAFGFYMGLIDSLKEEILRKFP